MAVLTDDSAAKANGSGVGALLARLSDHLRRRRVYWTTLRQLRSLSQRDLDDLGIARTMITRLATEAAWGKRN